jgi:DNA-binding PadR family transcriptional regulator
MVIPGIYSDSEYPARVPLTTTSYAILGLLDLREWSAYELTQQARRSLAFVWPMAESQLYAEPKRLAREGLIVIDEAAAGPQRTRQQLRITAAGRRELRRWLGSEPAAPRLQMEVLVRTLFATAGSRDDLLAALAATRSSAAAAYDDGRALVQSLRDGDNPFPERLHTNVLWMVFVHDLLRLTLDWVDLAEREVRRWDDTGVDSSDPARSRRLLDAMLIGRPVLGDRPRRPPP